jgi:predicted nucleic acid-binding protein
VTSPAGPLVVDASVAVKWLIYERESDDAEALQGRDMAAPALLRVEVANVLRTLVARGTVGLAEASELFGWFQAAPVAIVEHDDALEARALAIALEIGHPVYDCLYLALGERMGRTLVTADARFLTAVRSRRFASRAIALGADGTR